MNSLLASMSTNPNNPALPSLIDNITQNLFQHFANNPQLINQVLSTIFHRQHQQQSGQQEQEEEQQQQPSDGETVAPADESPIEIDGEDLPASQDSTNKSNAEDDVVETDFVCVDKEAVEEETSAADIDEEGASYDKKLEEAVAQMQQMGFDNDGGWLRQLLISKELDIGRVVDALRPPQP